MLQAMVMHHFNDKSKVQGVIIQNCTHYLKLTMNHNSSTGFSIRKSQFKHNGLHEVFTLVHQYRIQINLQPLYDSVFFCYPIHYTDERSKSVIFIVFMLVIIPWKVMFKHILLDLFHLNSKQKVREILQIPPVTNRN
jgi:hypothetical protein